MLPGENHPLVLRAGLVGVGEVRVGQPAEHRAVQLAGGGAVGLHEARGGAADAVER